MLWDGNFWSLRTKVTVRLCYVGGRLVDWTMESRGVLKVADWMNAICGTDGARRRKKMICVG